ncbi:MAG: leucine--tRNA ligase [Gemmatimonadetes bacterium]|nr:leucine--tRNA ligase [Gemmatimonadota bacterium]|tara:strand:+ start:228 stop:2756 length:2529 start_codon:yes stop_codon:yes gene_type:complete
MSGNENNGYKPIAIEGKWQARWEEEGTNSLSAELLERGENPYYNLMMFPYPSAEGLHVGNIYAFTGADVHGRFQQLAGHTVFEPIGFDAFGIHSENFALKQGVHPMDLIPSNVANFTRQLKRMGGMFDWDHTVDTTDPTYYRWTQWIFIQLFKAGLAVRKEAPVNWCPSCMTVLSNEQVIGGRCERCDTPVEQRNIAQWFFRITQYSQRLLDGLKNIDWSETTKKAQENWIGRSEGAILHFPILPEEQREHSFDGMSKDELFSATKDLKKIEVFTTRPDTVFGATYIVLSPEHPIVKDITSSQQEKAVQAYQEQTAKLDLVARQKTEKAKTGVFTGGYSLNPANGTAIPIWISDYVMMGYGTGAIMAVPGHDQRDFDFAKTMDLPIRQVVRSPKTSENNITDLLEAYAGDGFLINSQAFDGLPVQEAKKKICEWLKDIGLASVHIGYRLHDWCISRQRYWGPPIPIIHCDECGSVPVPEKDLPIVLPRIEDFKPDDSGVSPLARMEEWYITGCPECGATARRETDVSDTFLDSSWYFLRYPSSDSETAPFDSNITSKWLPVDCYIGGNEHAVLHLLYSRFITMALHDIGHIHFEEPFVRFRAHGLIIREGAKMSKSKGNVIIPDQVIEKYGADTFRTYLMFLGPFDEGGDYQDEGIQGPHGFLHRVWETATEALQNDSVEKNTVVERKLHQTIQQVTEQLPRLRYNTSIAALMEYLNVVRSKGRVPQKSEVEPLIVMIAPFAPHLAEDLWESFGHSESIFSGMNWPQYEPDKAREDNVEIAIQINGKLRGTITVETDIDKNSVEKIARAEKNIARYLDTAMVKRVVYVPNRLVNFVVESNNA